MRTRLRAAPRRPESRALVTVYAGALRIAAEPCGAALARNVAKVLHLQTVADECVTGATGLEPATSGVTGRRSNQLSYAPVGGTVWQPRIRTEAGPTSDPQTAFDPDRNWPEKRVFAWASTVQPGGGPRAQV